MTGQSLPPLRKPTTSQVLTITMTYCKNLRHTWSTALAVGYYKVIDFMTKATQKSFKYKCRKAMYANPNPTPFRGQMLIWRSILTNYLRIETLHKVCLLTDGCKSLNERVHIPNSDIARRPQPIPIFSKSPYQLCNRNKLPPKPKAIPPHLADSTGFG